MGDGAIVVNGDLLEYAPGAIALAGELIPPSYTGGVTGLRWLGFEDLEINNRGDVAFTGAALNGGGAPLCDCPRQPPLRRSPCGL